MFDTWDRIIVPTYAKMEQVIEWNERNVHWLKNVNIPLPLKRGVIEFQEEGLGLAFEQKSETTLMFTILGYTDKKEVKIASYEVSSDDLEMFTTYYPDTIDKKQIILLQAVLDADMTIEKLSAKFAFLMAFMVYYREELPVVSRIHNVSKKAKKGSKKPRNCRLITKVYKIENIDEIAAQTLKRPYTKPDTSVTARGHYRHYKNGKVVWIESYTRYKDKGSQRKVYEL